MLGTSKPNKDACKVQAARVLQLSLVKTRSKWLRTVKGLIARIYEVLPLLRPICGGQMRIIAFTTHSADIRQILEPIGVGTGPPGITPAHGPPLWDDEGVQPAPSWDEACQAAPDYEVDQRVNW